MSRAPNLARRATKRVLAGCCSAAADHDHDDDDDDAIERRKGEEEQAEEAKELALSIEDLAPTKEKQMRAPAYQLLLLPHRGPMVAWATLFRSLPRCLHRQEEEKGSGEAARSDEKISSLFSLNLKRKNERRRCVKNRGREENFLALSATSSLFFNPKASEAFSFRLLSPCLPPS